MTKQYQEITIGDREYRLDETAPYSAVEMLFQKDTEITGLSQLLRVTPQMLRDLPWTEYRALAVEVGRRIFPLDRETD